MSGIVAIGGGQAGFSFVQKLRSLGCNQKITLVCGEDILPYQRPPLSKKFLLGEMSKQQLLLRPESYYDDKNINLIIGKKALRIDRNLMEIELEDGVKLPYKKLFLGIGSSPKKLSDKRIYENKCVHYIRNFKDVELVSKEFNIKRSLLIIGGGYIGLEIAAVAKKRGLNVSIIESKDRILKRVTSERVGDYFRKLHEENGVKIKESVKIDDFLFEGKTFKGVLTNKGETIRGDFIIAGIGIKPNSKIAEESGLLVENGILVDEYCRTNDPNIFAAGDVVGPYQFTHVAAHQAWYAAVNALFGTFKKFKVDYRVIPWTTFIDPEVARVGLSERDAAEQDIDVEVTRYEFAELDRAVAESARKGFIKVLTPPGKDKILGVTIVSEHAGDLLAEFVMAMKHDLGLNKILGTIHAYPTWAEGAKYAAGNWKRANAPEKLLGFVEKFHTWRRG